MTAEVQDLSFDDLLGSVLVTPPEVPPSPAEGTRTSPREKNVETDELTAEGIEDLFDQQRSYSTVTFGHLLAPEEDQWYRDGDPETDAKSDMPQAVHGIEMTVASIDDTTVSIMEELKELRGGIEGLQSLRSEVRELATEVKNLNRAFAKFLKVLTDPTAT